MVDIQSPTYEIKRGKKERRRRRRGRNHKQDENIYGLPSALLHRAVITKDRMKIKWSALFHRATIKTNGIKLHKFSYRSDEKERSLVCV